MKLTPEQKEKILRAIEELPKHSEIHWHLVTTETLVAIRQEGGIEKKKII